MVDESTRGINITIDKRSNFFLSSNGIITYTFKMYTPNRIFLVNFVKITNKKIHHFISLMYLFNALAFLSKTIFN